MENANKVEDEKKVLKSPVRVKLGPFRLYHYTSYFTTITLLPLETTYKRKMKVEQDKGISAFIHSVSVLNLKLIIFVSNSFTIDVFL